MAIKSEMTLIRMKILFAILHNQQQKINAASMAQSLMVSKSTISRAVEFFQKQRLVKEDALELTAIGEQLVQKYWQQKEQLQKWLISDADMDSIEAEEEAIAILLHTRDKTIESLISQLGIQKRNCMLCDIDGFCDRCIDYLLDDGQYDISFTFYKDNLKRNMQVSMANDGFYHPGILQVKNGIGIIRLEAKKVVRSMPIGTGLIAGRVDRLSYLHDHQFKKAVQDGNVWTFPMSCLKFTYNKGEQVLMGSGGMKLRSSVGKVYMPESTAIFTMTLAL